MPTVSTSKDLHKSMAIINQRFRQSFYGLETGSKNLGELEANELKNEIETNYDAFIHSLGNDGENHNYRVHVVPRVDNGYKIEVTGLQVVYDEFGTGIVGFNNPHPNKNRYNLNGYNTGEKIHHFPDSSRDYWIFRTNGQFHITHGIRAGQFMYDSMRNMEEGLMSNINFEKVFGDVFKKGGK